MALALAFLAVELGWVSVGLADAMIPSSVQSSVEQRAVEEDVRPTSPRLFYMPVAQVVGAFEATISMEGSLLEERGVLSSAGVFAIGIGDLAQVEYRHTSAIGLSGGNVPLPAVGIQLKFPIELSPYIPAIALAYRLGIAHQENGAEEKATDVYGVAHFALPLGLDLHAGLRVTQASLRLGNLNAKETGFHPAIGLVRRTSVNTIVVAEIGSAPKFNIVDEKPSIDSGIAGRLGLRWRVHPRVSLDASAGYLAQSVSTDPNDVLAWDIRLGAEVFVPWGSMACQSLSIFCQSSQN